MYGISFRTDKMKKYVINFHNNIVFFYFHCYEKNKQKYLVLFNWINNFSVNLKYFVKLYKLLQLNYHTSFNANPY